MRRSTAPGRQAGAAPDDPIQRVREASRQPLARTMLVIAAAAFVFATVFGVHGLLADVAKELQAAAGFLAAGVLGLTAHRLLRAGRLEDGATVSIALFLAGAAMLAALLPGSAVVTTLGCIAVTTLALQHLSERRLVTVLVLAGLGIVGIVVVRQLGRPVPPEDAFGGAPLWLLDGAEVIGAAAMATIVGVLLLQFRRRLSGTITELRAHLDRERGLREENARQAQENASLETARGVAEEQGRARGEFLAHMSHEIRTPLNAVIGLAGLLEDADLDERSAEHARIIRASGDHLLTIVNDILDFSRIDAGELVIGTSEVPVGPLVEDVVDVLRVEADAKGITLTSRIDRDVPAVILADPARLRQILMNLLANAVRFTDAGEVQMTVALQGDGALVRFGVLDTGVGIAPERLAAVFEPFTQAEAFAARHRGGTGLGLAISRELATLMGGHLAATSVPGEGSFFTLDLPLRAARPAGAERGGATPAWMDAGMAERLPRRILVVEDSRTSQLVVVRLLERLGYRADVAADGAEALAALERQTYDVVFMDVHMPVLDGPNATRRIRERWTADRQPHIIAFTAAAFEADRRACLEAGMDDFVTKPATGPILAAALEQSRAVDP